MMITAYAPGGLVKVGPPPLQGSGAPATLPAKLGQEYFDTTTTPPTLYIFNGQTWTQPGSSSTSGLNVVGTTTINTTGAASTTIGTGGTGTVAIGNTTGNTAITGSLTASTGLVATAGGVTATLGNITATNGNLVLGTAGNKISIATGANASVGTSAALSGSGSVIVSTTAVTAASKIFLTANTAGGTQGELSAPTASIVAGTSFVINSSSTTDTSTVNWLIIN